MTLELRTVNHRFFNPSIKLPSALAQWEGELREQLRQGHRARARHRRARECERAGERCAGDRRAEGRALRGAAARAAAAARARRSGRRGDDSALSRRARERTQDQETAGTAAEVQSSPSEALDALTHMREVEGARLAALLEERISVVEGALDRIALRAPERLVAERERLTKAVRELTEGVDLDQQRLAQEIALLADRLDVSEEVDRFRSHVSAFRETLASGKKEPVGKRLGISVAGNAARGEHHGQQVEGRRDAARRRGGEGRAGADRRAGGEHRMKMFPVILSAPSGGGKTTIARRLLEMRGDVGYSVSCTTRPPRGDEVEGQDYYFLSTGRVPRAAAARRVRGVGDGARQSVRHAALAKSSAC